MNSRQIKQVLTLLSGIALAVSVATLLWSVASPLESIEFAGVRSATTRAAATSRATVNQNPSPREFEHIWATSFRQPLGDALPDTSPKVNPAKVDKPEVIAINTGVPAVTLIGTIGTSIALLKMVNNSVEALEIGETASGVTVLSIKPSEVEIKINGQSQTLTKPVDALLEK